jgi:hypothetical protein
MSSEKNKKVEDFLSLPPFHYYGLLGYAVRGPNRANFAASPSDILIRCDGESEVFGEAEMRDDPLSCSIYSFFSFTISLYALIWACSF